MLRESMCTIKAFNVGGTEENYQMRDVAKIVEDVVPNSVIAFSADAGPDKRNYRVNCDKLVEYLPAARPLWNVRRGVEELYEAYVRHGLTKEEFLGARYLRLKHVNALMEQGAIDEHLRWK